MIKRSAYRRNITFDISQKYAWDVYVRQCGKCIYTGIVLTFCREYRSNTASLDRIDSTKGYIIGNVQWVHKDINMAKRTMKHLDFIELCKKVTYNSI